MLTMVNIIIIKTGAYKHLRHILELLWYKVKEVHGINKTNTMVSTILNVSNIF